MSEPTNERKKGFSWSSGLALYTRTRLRLSLVTLADSVKKNKKCSNQFFFTIVFFFFFYSKYTCACADRVHQLALNDDERSLVLLFPCSLYRFFFSCSTTSKKKGERIVVSNGKRGRERERTREKMVSCCYLMVNQQTTKTTQSYFL